MKKVLIKLGGVIASLALMVTAMNVNTDYFTPITSPYSWFGNHLYTLEASVLHC